MKAPVTCVFLATLNCNPVRMLLASKIRRCIEQIIQCPLILTFDSIQPGLQHRPIQSTSNNGFWWIFTKIIITCHHQICWFGLPVLAFTYWCLCMVSFLSESCHRLPISGWHPRRGTSLNIVSTREHSPRLNCEDLPTWATKTHSLHQWQVDASGGKNQGRKYSKNYGCNRTRANLNEIIAWNCWFSDTRFAMFAKYVMHWRSGNFGMSSEDLEVWYP